MRLAFFCQPVRFSRETIWRLGGGLMGAYSSIPNLQAAEMRLPSSSAQWLSLKWRRSTHCSAASNAPAARQAAKRTKAAPKQGPATLSMPERVRDSHAWLQGWQRCLAVNQQWLMQAHHLVLYCQWELPPALKALLLCTAITTDIAPDSPLGEGANSQLPQEQESFRMWLF